MASGTQFSLDDNTGATGDDIGAVDLIGADTGGLADSDGGDDFTFDPDRHIDPSKRNADGSYRRKRRRRGSGSSAGSGSGPRGKKADYSASIDALSTVLAMGFGTLAAVAKEPIWNLEKLESDAGAKALANLLEQFEIMPDPKIQAVVGCAIVFSGIIAPRMYLISEKKKEAKKAPTEAPIYAATGEIIQ